VPYTEPLLGKRRINHIPNSSLTFYDYYCRVNDNTDVHQNYQKFMKFRF
jgi:hypothetical protein